MANGRFILGKQSGGTLGLVFPDGVENTEVVLPESGELVNKAYADLKAALASFVGANQSLTYNGYQKLPGGLIIQWGNIENGLIANTTTNFNYPIAFPNAALSGSLSPKGSIASSISSNVFTRQYVGVRCGEVASSGATYIVIGY